MPIVRFSSHRHYETYHWCKPQPQPGSRVTTVRFARLTSPARRRTGGGYMPTVLSECMSSWAFGPRNPMKNSRGWRRRAVVWHVCAPVQKAHTSRQSTAGRMRHPGFSTLRPLRSQEHTAARFACRGPLRWPSGKSRARQWTHTSRQQASRRLRHPRDPSY